MQHLPPAVELCGHGGGEGGEGREGEGRGRLPLWGVPGMEEAGEGVEEITGGGVRGHPGKGGVERGERCWRDDGSGW